jgi:hypothetical protein
MTNRMLTVQSDSEKPVTVHWPQCRPRLYFAVALYGGKWAFTLL